MLRSGANNEDGSCKTQAQWETAFKKLKALPHHYRSARLYASSDCNTLAHAVPAAKKTGTKLMVGVWTEDATHFTQEKNALKRAIRKHGHGWIHSISVGSEDLYRGDTTADTLAQQIYDVRGMVRAMGVKAKVGHVDTWNAWTNAGNNAVIKAVDFVGMDACMFYFSAVCVHPLTW
jgi:exo-beta-1,3-glucanase (GH17 family)